MITILQGDCLARLPEIPDNSVHCCVTSPPYWGLRDYGVAGQLGLEKTPEEYVAKMVEVFREVRRVLRGDGTLWLNLGDSYARDFAKGGSGPNGKHDYIPAYGNARQEMRRGSARADGIVTDTSPRNRDGTFVNASSPPLKPKDLVGIPWRVAFALQADGWYLRSEIIWAKRNCMPESVEDRPAKSHEQIFLFSKNERYFYDAEAVKQPASESYANDSRWDTGSTEFNYKDGYSEAMAQNPKAPHRVFDGERRTSVNLRDVWHLTTEPYSDSHFATFPTDIARRAILAGTSAKGCCAKCGAPWVRIVEHGSPKKSGGGNTTGHADGPMDRNGKGQWDEGAMVTMREGQTIGWQPTCSCGEQATVPAVVLDPFGGSGTTGQVALELGRKAILIELNPKYIELIEKRTFVTPGFQLA